MSCDRHRWLCGSFAISLGLDVGHAGRIFPNEERPQAISVVGFWNSLVSASVTLLFPTEVAVWVRALFSPMDWLLPPVWFG